MRADKLIEELQKLPPETIIWNYNDGQPIPIEEISLNTNDDGILVFFIW